MNKQQLAARIWAMANDMRSKIAANEYKDFILWFMFYKFLSDKELDFLRNEWISWEEIKSLSEEDKETTNFIKNNLGYFIGYNNLFSTWTTKSDFDISDVTDALSDFNYNIHENHKNVYEKIFNTLETWLSKLWDNTKSQTLAVKKIINLIKTIPMDSSSDYDVLGFIYEYLISNFAANAGKKAGEFYTPHEVSLLMSEIIAHHLKDSDQIKIYDPTSWSGSLLINIGKSVAKHVKDPKSIVYYAQELKSETYNLTRMNLVMRGISSHNIHARNADTLEDDWPQMDETGNIADPLYLDAVVSNPPYSQKWNPEDKEWDPRYTGYGIAPQGKADYAFLLHDLYHIKPDGIMTIVLPHGVLFRGGEEYEIRKNLIEKNNIDTIIGLPSNIFFGTGIPTIIMVLKKRKPDTNIQIIDASKFYIKDGKNNKLRACDIKRIVDIIMARKDKEKFSRIVSRDEIVENDYNLNIPRYVDSSETPEQRDIYATMFGGIPAQELEHYDHYFELFPGLKEQLFHANNDKYFSAKTENIADEIRDHAAVLAYKENFEKTFAPFRQILKTELIDSYQKIDVNAMESKLWDQLFNLLDTIKLVDNYDAYQILSDNWTNISGNLEILKAEGFDACKKVDENLVRKKDEKSKELIEVADGYRGRIFDFEVIKKYKLQEETANIEKQKEALNAITAQYEELFSNLTEDQQEALWDAISEESFVNKEITAKAKEIKKENKNLNFDQESPEFIVLKVNALIEQEKSLNKSIKELEAQLLTKIMHTIEHLSDEEILQLLEHQWIDPIMDQVHELFENALKDFAKGLQKLSEKYAITLSDLETQIQENGKALSEMIDELTGDDFDLKGLEAFKSLLND